MFRTPRGSWRRAVRSLAFSVRQLLRYATPRAYGQPPGEPCLCGGGKRGGFLIVNVNLFYSRGATHGIHYRVEAVPHQLVDAWHPGVAQLLH